jgi:transcriptional regulator with XRE-family HTH domain
LADLVKQVANWDIAGLVGIRRIEEGKRRVSPDDLVALALALGVSPLALMLPTEASQIVPNDEVYTASEIWDWATGRRALSGDQLDFVRASNPLDWPRMAELIEHLRIGDKPDLAAGVLASRGSPVGHYEPAPEVSAEEAAEIYRSVQADGDSQ